MASNCWIACEPWSSALCVVLISAYADAPLVDRAMKGGAVAFIEKPYKNDELADAVRKAMDRMRTRGSQPRNPMVTGFSKNVF